MSNTQMMEQIAASAPRLGTKFVIAYYLLTILTSTFILFFHGSLAVTVDLLAALFYLAVTAILYDLSRPKQKSIRLLATLLNVVVFALGKLSFLLHSRTADRVAARGA